MKNRHQGKKSELFALIPLIVLLLQHIKNRNHRFPAWQGYPSNLLFTYFIQHKTFYSALP